MELVEFRVISGYSMYSVGSDGSIKNNKTGRILKQTNNQGYWMISIKNDFKIRVTLQVHRIVAFAFTPNPMNKPLVNHRDCDKGNNNVVNLEWSTLSENIRHAFDNGLCQNHKENCRRMGLKNWRKAVMSKAKKVIDTETNTVFDSIVECANKNGINSQTLTQKLSGKRRNNTKFKYYEQDKDNKLREVL